MTDDKLTRCLVLLEEQTKDITEIKDGIKEQNGRVRKLENDNIRIKTIWSGLVLVGGFGLDYLRHKLGGGA